MPVPLELLGAGALLLTLAGVVRGQDLSALQVGHWAVVKGEYEGDLRWTADEVELAEEPGEHVLRGVVERAEGDLLWMHDQRIELSEETKYRRVEPGALVGVRVEVVGRYKGERNFSAEVVALRESGRDRVGGRVDEIVRRPDGSLELRILKYRFVTTPETDLDLPEGLELADAPLFPAVEFGTAPVLRGRDDDDDVPQAFRLGETLTAGVQLEWRLEDERELDLDPTDDEDRRDNQFGVRAELVYRPEGNFTGLLGLRHSTRLRDDAEDGYEETSDTRVAEMYGLWTDVAPGWDVQLGRQDFDDKREWLYDQNLDALRVTWHGDELRLELSASTTFSNGSAADEATDNLIAYLSNGDPDRHWAAYVVDRRDRRDVPDYPFHAGLRAHGEWLPDHDVWAELAAVRGYTGDTDLEGYALDLGTTWAPPAIDPWYLTAGFALGSGDGDPGDGVDESFRQTGLHDNNDKFGGVTSFRYYGELADPELSNLRITTLGVGRRLGRRHSLDLVWHAYEQDVASDRWRDAGVDARPDGVHTDLGQALDLIWGTRSTSGWRVEVVLATFDPGAAFDDDVDDAWLAKIHLRYRF